MLSVIGTYKSERCLGGSANSRAGLRDDIGIGRLGRERCVEALEQARFGEAREALFTTSLQELTQFAHTQCRILVFAVSADGEATSPVAEGLLDPGIRVAQDEEAFEERHCTQG